MASRSSFASVLVIGVVAVGCSTSAHPTEADAGAAKAPAPVVLDVASATPEARAIVARLARTPGIGEHVGRGGVLAKVGDAFRLERFTIASTGAWTRLPRTTVNAALPARADGATRIASGVAPDAWIEISPLGLEPKPGVPVDGALVFRDAARSTDVVEVVEPGRVEELRVLRGPDALSTARYQVRRSDAIASLRVREGVVEAIDRDGVVRLATEPAFAVDANGARRALDVWLEDAGDTLVARLDPKGLAYPIAVDPTWTAIPAPAGDHDGGSGVAVTASGKVVFVGGFTNDDVSVFDPATKTFTTAAAMGANRGAPAVFAFGDKVLAAGGSSVPVAVLASSEIFDLATGAWSPGPAMSVTRRSMASVPLEAGRLLVVGGATTDATRLSTAEIFDAASSTWASAGTFSEPRVNPFAVRLNDGRVLIGGGRFRQSPAPTASTTAELWSGGTTWTATGSMGTPRENAAAVVLPSGKVLVHGGMLAPPFTGGGTPTTFHSSAEIYDPATGTWSPTGSTPKSYDGHMLAVLPTGKVLLANSDSYLFDPATGTWSPAGKATFDPLVSVLPSGEALVVNGDEAFLFSQASNGATCAADYDCKSGACNDGVCCSAHCGAFACVSGTCATSCTSDAQCVSTHFCSGGACAPKKAIAAACAAASECQSGACADGVCCNVACTGKCEACDVTPGTCTAVTGAPHGARGACGGVGAGTECGQACDGVDRAACHYPGLKPCGVNACSGGVETHASLCDGAGKCNDVPKSCGAYECDATACKSSCATNDDCATGFTCVAGVCSAGPTPVLGSPCTDATTCPSGTFCTDGVCCAVAACSAGSSCATAAKKGACAKLPGTSCASGAECGSGFCADGVCCDRACNGQCEACDVIGATGTCTAVTGAPHGAREACPTDASDVCKSRTCDGKDALACAGFAGTSTRCADPTCSGSTFTAASTCDGEGACEPGPSTACSPYACDAKGCRTTCAGDAQCAKGFTCEDGTCVPTTGGTCADDDLVSIDKDGTRRDCAPYRCRADGVCGTTCGTSDDCAPGAVCDPSSKVCAPSTPVEDAGGGCSVAGSGSSSTTALGLALAAAAMLARRRRL